MRPREVAPVPPVGDDDGAVSAMCAAATLGDEALADAIDRDVADRLVRGLPVPLSRYLSIMGEASRRPLSLDAAVDGSLRALAAAGCSPPEAVAQLTNEHPELRRIIESTATISMLFGPSGAAHEVLDVGVERSIPSRLGKSLPDGKGRYELVKALGARRPARVFLAIDHLLSTPEVRVDVVVKILGRAGDQAQLDEAIDEARLLRSLRHPSIVGLVDSGVSDDAEVYLVTEFVHGASLRDHVESKGPLRPAEAVRLVASIAHAIGMAHRAGVVHCDLSPSNILIDAEGRGRIVDLGSAARVGSSAPAERALRGTPGFMPPEQSDPAVPAAPTIDVYALGAVLFWLLTGTSANGCDSAEIDGLLRGQRNPRAARVEALSAGGVPRGLARLALSSIELDPARRPVDGDALARVLDAWLEADAQARLPWNDRIIAWGRRHPRVALLLTVGATAAITLALVTALVAPREAPRRGVEYTLMAARTDRSLAFAMSRYDRSLRVERDEARAMLARLPQILGVSKSSIEPLRQWISGPEGRRFASLLAGLQIIAGRHGESEQIDALVLRAALATLLLAQARDPTTALRAGGQDLEVLLSPGDPLRSIAIAVRRAATARVVTESIRSIRGRPATVSPEQALVELEASIRENTVAGRDLIVRLLQEQRDLLRAAMVERSSRPAISGARTEGAAAPRPD